MITPRTMRRGVRRIVRRLTSARAGAILVATTVGLTGLLSPISAEAAVDPTPCIGGFLCAGTSVASQPKLGSINTPKPSFDVPESSIVNQGITEERKRPKVTPKLVGVTGIAAALVTCAIKCFQPGGSGGSGPKGNPPPRRQTTQTKPTTPGHAPGPGQRPQPKRPGQPPHKPQGPGKRTDPGVKPKGVPGGPATSIPRNAKSGRGSKGKQQAGRRKPTRHQQKAAAKHAARSQAVKKATARRRQKRREAIVLGMRVAAQVAGKAHAFGPGGHGSTGLSDSFSPTPPRPPNRKGNRLEKQKKVLMPPQVHQLRGHDPSTNRNARIQQSHLANQVKHRLPPPPQKGAGRHRGKARH